MSTPRKPPLRWRKAARGSTQWLSGEPQGYELTQGGAVVARVGGGRKVGGFGPCDTYYWYGGRDYDIPRRNTAGERRYWPLTPEGLEAAKADCLAYVRECLAKGDGVE